MIQIAYSDKAKATLWSTVYTLHLMNCVKRKAHKSRLTVSSVLFVQINRKNEVRSEFMISRVLT